MVFSKFSLSSISLAGIVLLVGGLGVAVLGLQHQQDSRSRASTTMDPRTYSRQIDCNEASQATAMHFCLHDNWNNCVDEQPPDSRFTYVCSGEHYPFRADCTTSQTWRVISDSNIVPLSGSLASKVSSGLCQNYTPKALQQAPPSCSSKGGVCQYASCGSNQSNVAATCNNDYMVCCTPPSSSGGSTGGTGSSGGTGSTSSTGSTGSTSSGGGTSSGGSTSSGDANYIGKSCSTPQGSGTCQYYNNGSGNCSGTFVKNYCPGSTNVVCCVGAQSAPAPVQPQACGDTSAPTGTLLSQNATTTESSHIDNNFSKNAVDGDQNTSWNSGNYPPQWIEINLGSKKTVTGLKLFVNQDPNGATTHQILTGANPSPTTVSKTLSCVTGNNQTINVVFDTPLTNVQYIRINTPTGVSWVAWKEIQVYGENPVVEQPQDTKLSFTLLLHGIGKGGDNVTDHDPNHASNAVNGTTNLHHIPRAVTVQVLNPLDNSVVASKDTSAAYNATPGNFTISDLDMGATLAGPYVIQIISQSLRGRTPNTVNLAAGPNTIPVMRLVNGDADLNGYLDIRDYKLIEGCMDPFGQGAADCPGDNAAQADINDDGKVDEIDLELLIRELSVNSL